MKKIFTAVYLAAFTILVMSAVIVLAIVKNNKPGAYDALAQCLTDQGVVMYGTWWCPNCQHQKDDFGASFKKINYVECSPGGIREFSPSCLDLGIDSVPRWIFPTGEPMIGYQPLAALAERSGCPLTQ